jgi:hypothetical protein
VLQNAPGKKLDDLGTITSITSEPITRPKVPTDAIEETTTPAPVTPTFDAASGQFVFTWQTQKACAGTCRRLHLTLLDGSIHDADFQSSNAKKEPRRSGALNR